MRILALDTATEACSASLLVDKADGAFEQVGRFEEVGRGHAERILGMIDATLAEAGVSLSMLDGIAASVGPGSFTGVRISVSVAQGLAFGAGLPVIPVTTLEALARQAVRGGADRILTCLDARMGEVYWGCFAVADRDLVAYSGLAVDGPGRVVAPFAEGFHGIGRGFAAYPNLKTLPRIIVTSEACTALPDARDMAVLGANRLRSGGGLDPADLEPRYLRDKVALTEAERAKMTEL